MKLKEKAEADNTGHAVRDTTWRLFGMSMFTSCMHLDIGYSANSIRLSAALLAAYLGNEIQLEAWCRHIGRGEAELARTRISLDLAKDLHYQTKLIFPVVPKISVATINLE